MPEQNFERQDDDEPLFMAIDNSDPEYLATIDEAQDTLDTFEELFNKYKDELGVYFAFKTSIIDDNDTSYLWYSVVSIDNGFFIGEHFEIPAELEKYSNVKVTKDQIYDWMINDHGVLYGGFSIRYMRSLVSDSKKAEFDEYTGVTEYKDI